MPRITLILALLATFALFSASLLLGGCDREYTQREAIQVKFLGGNVTVYYDPDSPVVIPLDSCPPCPDTPAYTPSLDSIPTFDYESFSFAGFPDWDSNAVWIDTVWLKRFFTMPPCTVYLPQPCPDTVYQMPKGQWVKIEGSGFHSQRWVGEGDDWKLVTRSWYDFPWPDSLGKPDSVFILSPKDPRP